MRNILIITIILFFKIGLAQTNNDRAMAEYFAAEEAYNNANYEQAIEHLDKAETLLGNTNSKILYLKVKSYSNYPKLNISTEEKAYLALEKYFELATDNSDSKYIEMVKFWNKFSEGGAYHYYQSGKNYKKAGVLDSAIYSLIKSIEVNEKWHCGFAYLNLAQIYEENYKDLEKAEKYRILAAFNCKYADYMQLLEFYLRTNQKDKFNITVQKAINEDKDKLAQLPFNSYHYYFEIAIYYYLMNDKQNSLNHFELGLQSHKNSDTVKKLIKGDLNCDQQFKPYICRLLDDEDYQILIKKSKIFD